MNTMKFRAFDGVEMRYDIKGLECYPVGCVAGVNIDEDYFRLIEGIIAFHPLAKLMIFTGLKDVNGVLIYEGDIVKVTTDSEDLDSDFLHEVKWNSDAGCFPVDVHGDYDLTTMHWAIDTHHYGYEVVGNIYQNPELIKMDGE